jgi:hypothetical protein
MEHRIVPVEAIDDKRVLTGVATRFRGRYSGVNFEDQQTASLATVRGEKIVHTESFVSPEEVTVGGRYPVTTASAVEREPDHR